MQLEFVLQELNNQMRMQTTDCCIDQMKFDFHFFQNTAKVLENSGGRRKL